MGSSWTSFGTLKSVLVGNESKFKKAWYMRLALSQNNYATLEMRKKLSYRGN